MVPCTIEEVDERIFFHEKNVAQSNSKILVKTVNSDSQYVIVYLTSMNYEGKYGGESIKLWSNVSKHSSILPGSKWL